MRTVHEVSELAGVSIRSLQYYDKIGLLHPSRYSEAGYRLYDDTDLERLQQILLFRELEFPLKEIKRIINRPDYDRAKALEQQITLLTLKKERIEQLITLAREIQTTGGNVMDFKAFDTAKLDEYAARAKAAWGGTPEYKEFEAREQDRTPAEQQDRVQGLMSIFAEFAAIREQEPGSEQAQGLVKKLQDYITEHFYTCSKEVLKGLGQIYGSGGEFTQNINASAGEGTAEFAAAAIAVYCK